MLQLLGTFDCQELEVFRFFLGIEGLYDKVIGLSTLAQGPQGP